MIAKLRRLIAALLVVSISAMGMPLPANAGMVVTDAAVASGDRERIASVLDRPDVRARLESYGVDSSEVKARVAALTDEEAAQLAGRIDSLPAGGDGGFGALVGAAVFVFLILLITDLLGLTKVFPFTRAVR